jgi:predicted phage terminase large subunit-like protein
MTTPAHKIAEDVLNDLWRLTPCRMAAELTEGRFKRFKHIDYVSHKIASAVMKGNARIIVSMPPRHGKSTLISTWFPVWYLSLFPDKNIILSSYEADFAASWGRVVRNNIIEHGKRLGVDLRDDSQAANRWNTTQGGGMITAGIGGAITGRGGHVIIVDDPVKDFEQATSETYRQKTIDWFHTTLATRAEPGASIIILMTRWHESDLVGHLLSQPDSEWEEIRLPAVAEEGDPIGRLPGAALCPERYDLAALEKFRINNGSRVFNSLYQQRPSAEEGNIFKRDWWRFYDEIPDNFDSMLISCDLAFKETKTSDYVVFQCWGSVGPNRYLIDQVRRRLDFTGTLQALRDFRNKHSDVTLTLIEDKANGPAIIDVLNREISGIVPVEPDGSKESRASAVSPQIESGNIYLPNPALNPWVEDFIEEFANFPNGKHDDQVDTCSQALRRMQTTVVTFMPFSIQRVTNITW